MSKAGTVNVVNNNNNSNYKLLILVVMLLIVIMITSSIYYTASSKPNGLQTLSDFYSPKACEMGWYSLRYSCLENSMDRGAWWATVHGVTKSWIPLSD